MLEQGKDHASIRTTIKSDRSNMAKHFTNTFVIFLKQLKKEYLLLKQLLRTSSLKERSPVTVMWYWIYVLRDFGIRKG